MSLVTLAALAVHAEETPSQRPAPVQAGAEIDEPALPTSETVPSNPESGLLPGSGELPGRPPVVAPRAPSSDMSTGKAPAEAMRFEVIHTLAMGDLRATRLLRRARQSSNSASRRRSYLRAYYTVVASRMRQLDPKLKSSINAYEEGKLRELSSVKSSTRAVSSHSSRVHRSTRLAGHHRWHRFSEEHRYRRFIIIEAPYGPYGPEFSPYGPPIVFEPR
jgi:hypothetical protein